MSNLLINLGTDLSQFGTGWQSENQIARGRVEAQVLLPLEGDLDLVGIRPRLEEEVVLEITVIAINLNPAVSLWLVTRLGAQAGHFGANRGR